MGNGKPTAAPLQVMRLHPVQIIKNSIMETDELRIKCIDDRKPHQHNLHSGGGRGERIAPMGKVSNVNSLETTRTQKVLISAFKLMLKTFPAEFRSVDNSLFRAS